MTFIRTLLLLGAIGFAAGAVLQAQSSASKPLDARNASRTTSAAKALPDPDLFDGSNLPPEKEPEFGMLGEFEMPGGEERSERVGGSSDSLSSGGGLPQLAGGGAPSLPSSGNNPLQISQSGGGKPPEANDPNATAAGIRAQELKGGQPGQENQGGPMGKPREIAVGDATLQIEPAGSSADAKDIVGTTAEAGNQRYKRDPAQGQQSNPANVGVEKGRTMPAGL